MNRIILNEREFAEECLQTLETDIDTYSTLMILAKYFFSYGYKDEEVYDRLINFLVDSQSVEYAGSKQYWENTCESIVKKAVKYPLLEIDGVWVTHKEFEEIKKISNSPLERLAFTLLCLAKYSKEKNGTYWVNFGYKDIFSMARVTCKADDRVIKVRDLILRGYLSLAKQIDNLSLKITFADEDTTEFSEENGDLFVSDFRELGYEYRKYRGENFIRCAECGILTKGGVRNSKRYCSKCAGKNNGAKIINKNQKQILCKDCGKIIFVSKFDSKTCRCKDCQTEANKASKRKWKKNNN